MSANMREVARKHKKKLNMKLGPHRAKNVQNLKTGVVLFVPLLIISRWLQKSNHLE